ncbi:MAG: DUF4249 domain-containing protein [Ginsengibacter sp.]
MFYCIGILSFENCKVPYDPTLKTTDTNSLVVSGFIDGASPVIITLTRSRMLTTGDTASRKFESGAKIIVEDDQQNSYSLQETGKGIYSSLNTLPLNHSHQYRLHIFTSNGKEYVSDLVPFKLSPAIDSIGWKLKDGGVQVYVNTHDPNDSTKYYRWEYNQTWEFHPHYKSYYEYNPTDTTVVPRMAPVAACWYSDSSTNIFLGSSTKLSNDIIYQLPLPYIQPHDPKLSVLYSILVKQYPLDLNGYNYWLAMKNNTENVGSIFDSQPNNTIGNIHCVTNAAEKVVGYINAGKSMKKRIFISNSSLPDGWDNYQYCTFFIVPNIKDSLRFYFGGGDNVPISNGPPFVTPSISYYASSTECVDCTIKGANIKPSFWP